MTTSSSSPAPPTSSSGWFGGARQDDVRPDLEIVQGSDGSDVFEGEAPVVRPPSTAPPGDTKAPRAALFARSGGGLVKSLRRTSLRMRVGCDEPCSATATVTAHGATARSLARRGHRRTTIVARGTSKPGTLSVLALKQTARGKKMLRALRSGRYRLTVIVTDAAGNRTTVRRVVTVRR